MTRTLALAAAVLALAIGTAAANPSGTNVVISEIMANPQFTYDGAEYIELYNPTAAPINIGGWVLTGTEYGVYASGGGICGGEDRWQFPTGTSIRRTATSSSPRTAATATTGSTRSTGSIPTSRCSTTWPTSSRSTTPARRT